MFPFVCRNLTLRSRPIHMRDTCDPLTRHNSRTLFRIYNLLIEVVSHMVTNLPVREDT